MIIKNIRLIKNIIQKPQRVGLRPFHIQLEPTNNCNLKCKMCIRNEMNFKDHSMSFDEYKTVFDMIKPSKITFAGAGEPTCSADLFRMIEYAKKNNSSVMIASNMIINEKKLTDLVTSGLDTLKVSVDASDEKTYLKIRGIDHFKRIIDNIEKLKEIKNKHNSKNPDIRFDFVILKENYRCMVDLVLLAGRMNVKNIFFRPLQSVGISGDRQNELTDQMDYNDLYYYMKTAYKTGVANRINTNLGFLLNFFENFKSIYTNRDSKFENDICLLPWFQMFVSANGDTAPCCAIHSNIKMSMGNVLKDGLENVWNGKGFTDLRRFFKSKGKYDICRDCIPKGFNQLFSMVSLLPNFVKKH